MEKRRYLAQWPKFNIEKILNLEYQKSIEKKHLNSFFMVD